MDWHAGCIAVSEVQTVRRTIEISRVGVLAVLLAGTIPLAVAQEQQVDRRGFLFELGAGPASIYYGPDVESLVTGSGLQRLDLALHLAVGYAIVQNLYVIGIAQGAATRFYDYFDYLQLNSYLFGGGVRVYPFHTGLVLGLDAGAGRMVAQSSVGVGGTAPAGWATALSAAYDFNRRATGFGFQAGVRVFHVSLPTSAATAASAFVSIAWK